MGEDLKLPYFHPDYLNVIYRVEKNGLPEQYLYEENSGTVYYQYVRRPIPNSSGFDIITPFDYGGYYASDNRLLTGFLKDFGEHCKTTGIVTEFIRFLPTHHFPLSTLRRYLTIVKVCDQVYVDLCKDIHSQMSKTKRRNIKTAKVLHLSVKKEETCGQFLSVYLTTMERRGANPYFSFTEEVFNGLTNLPCVDIWSVYLQTKLCGSVMILTNGTVAYYFLSGSDPAYYYTRSQSYLLYRVAQYYARKGYKMLFLGGGSEGVMKFKAGFSDCRMPYYVGKRIHNRAVYNSLPTVSEGYFPKYRERVI